jgi:hypothetical protein
MTLLGFFEGGGVAAALRLLTQVLEESAPGLADELSADSPLGVRAEIGMVGTGVSPSKPGIGEMMFFKAYIQRYRE